MVQEILEKVDSHLVIREIISDRIQEMLGEIEEIETKKEREKVRI